MIDLTSLTPRQLEVYQLLVQGLSNREIAVRLCLSLRTIELVNSEIYAKLGVSRSKLIAKSLSQVRP